MKAKELRELSDLDLKKELEKALKAHFLLRKQVALQTLRRFSELKKVRTDIARINTIIRERVKANGK